MRKLVLFGAVLAVCVGLAPAEAVAKTRRVPTTLEVDIVGVIDRHASVAYAWGGEVGTPGVILRCTEQRRVTLFRLDESGNPSAVASATSEFLGSFGAPLERPIAAVPGYYYAEVAESKFKSRYGKFRCLAMRSPTFLVQVPAGLLP